MNEVTLNLAELEARARERMLEADALGYRDMCLRAYGTLTNCALLSVKELTAGMVKVKLGAALGFFEAEDMDALERFYRAYAPRFLQARQLSRSEGRAGMRHPAREDRP